MCADAGVAKSQVVKEMPPVDKTGGIFIAIRTICQSV